MLMRLLILSDSHTDVEAMQKAVRREKPDVILHLGDHFTDAQELGRSFPDIPLHAVEGNTDYAPGAPVELLLPFEGKRIYMTHGHLFGVKMGISGISRKGAAVGADLVLFGHTHKPFLRNEGQMLLFNPGSVGKCIRGLTYNIPTYGVVTIEDGELKCDIRQGGQRG